MSMAKGVFLALVHDPVYFANAVECIVLIDKNLYKMPAIVAHFTTTQPQKRKAYRRNLIGYLI
jgi:hypothetical protein